MSNFLHGFTIIDTSINFSLLQSLSSNKCIYFIGIFRFIFQLLLLMEFLGMAFVTIKFCRYVTAIHRLCQYLFVRDCIFFMTLHVTYGLIIKVRYSAKRLIMLELNPVSVPVQRQRIFLCLNVPPLPPSPLPPPLSPLPSPLPSPLTQQDAGQLIAGLHLLQH